MDYIITTNELGTWLKEENIELNELEDSNFDELTGTGAGYIFGCSGGVTESALRTAYYLITGNIAPSDFFDLKQVRGIEGMKYADVKIGDKNLKLAVVSTTANARKLLKQIEEENVKYDFVEVMACPSGCISGAGQPKTTTPITNEIRQKRMDGLYNYDSKCKTKSSFENEQIIAIYKEFLNNPLSEKSINLIHTSYINKENILN